MSEIDSGVDTSLNTNSESIFAKTKEKAKIYAENLLNNPQKLKDPNHFNFYGAFTGSEGDYIFHQRQALEEIAAKSGEHTINHPAPTSIEEHAHWFINSLLNADPEETRNALLARKNLEYPAGALLQSIKEKTEKNGLNPESIKSINHLYRDLTQVIDYLLPPLKVNLPESQVNHIEFHLGDPLPEHYQNPLTELKKVAPDKFMKQATRLAYYFHSLDTGQKLFDENGQSLDAEVSNLADEVAKLPSFDLVYVFDSLPKSARSTTLSPGKSLPKWIISRRDSIDSESTPSTIPEINKFYNKYAPNHGKSEDLQHGKYFFYDKEICPEKSNSPVDTFKCYLEKDARTEDLNNLFQELGEQKIHPHSSKLVDEGDRLVLYWHTNLNDEIANKLKNLFYKNNVSYRGFGQDSIIGEIEKNGHLNFSAKYSNDQSRGEAGGAADFAHNEYSPQRFFELYLQQMFKHHRNPLDPNRMSFVPILDQGNTPFDPNTLQKEIDDIKKRGLDVVQYQYAVPVIFK